MENMSTPVFPLRLKIRLHNPAFFRSTIFSGTRTFFIPNLLVIREVR